MAGDDDSVNRIPENPEAATALEERLAAPFDRLAALIADFILISPVATLVMSPFRKLAQESLLQGLDDAWMISTIAAIGASTLLFVAYQTYFLMKWRATPGKRLMSLTVESLWEPEGTPMRLPAAFLRSLTMCSEVLFLGLPFIGVIGNDRRRPFHDRIADTIVLSKKRSTAGVPGLSERSLASGLVASFFMSLAVVVIFKTSELKIGPSFLASSSPAPAQCEEIATAEKNWIPAIGETKPSRMTLALALFEAEAIDDDCLKSEADAALWAKGERDLSYLARGLAEKTDDELSQSYLNKACDGREETEACQALAFLNADDAPDDPVEAKSSQIERENDLLSMIESFTPATSPFLKVLAIRELSQRKLEARALQLIDGFAPQKPLAYFLASERTKALWAVGQKQDSRIAMKSAIAGFDADQRVALTRWFCFAETSDSGCSVQARSSCDLLTASVRNDRVLLGDPEVVVSYLRGETCSARVSEKSLAELNAEMPDKSTHAYVDALSAVARGDEAAGVAKLKAIAVSENEEGPFVTEARLKLADLAKSEKDLSVLREAWTDDDPKAEGWIQLARVLMEKYNRLGAWDQTVEIGFKLGEQDQMNASTARPVVVAAYRSGQIKMAAGYLQNYFKTSDSFAFPSSDSRLPASVDDEFAQVVRDIATDLTSPPVKNRERTSSPSFRGPSK